MENRKAIIALVLICIIWGTTYLFLKIGVNNMDPFFFSGIRQVSAGVILLLLLKIMRKYDGISRKQLIHQSIAGILMITLGNGLVAYAEVVIPSSIAAIICATMPV
ncbi:MAG TPA: EamA family transporter, partial [Saprospiraceae bacterium]|nr:EamA family transporter [Saprospiraceae bacterium]